MTGFIAANYAKYAQNGKAIPYLERAVEGSDIWTVCLFYPEFDGLRGDPRFLALIKKMSHPDDVYRRPYRELVASGGR